VLRIGGHDEGGVCLMLERMPGSGAEGKPWGEFGGRNREGEVEGRGKTEWDKGQCRILGDIRKLGKGKGEGRAREMGREKRGKKGN